jgi:hypothetical protein
MRYAMYLDIILRIFCAHYFEFIFKSLPAWWKQTIWNVAPNYGDVFTGLPLQRL